MNRVCIRVGDRSVGSNRLERHSECTAQTTGVYDPSDGFRVDPGEHTVVPPGSELINHIVPAGVRKEVTKGILLPARGPSPGHLVWQPQEITVELNLNGDHAFMIFSQRMDIFGGE